MKTNIENRLYFSIKQWALISVAFTISFPIIINNIAIALFILSGLRLFNKDAFTNQLKLAAPFFSYYVIILLGLLFISCPDNTLFPLEQKASLIIIPLGFCLTNYNERDRNLTLWAFSMGILLTTIISFGGAVLNQINNQNANVSHNWSFKDNLEFVEKYGDSFINWNYFSYNQLSSSVFSLHPVYFSVFIIFSIYILIYFLLKDKPKRIYSILLIFAISYKLLILFLIGAKAPILIFIFSFPIAALVLILRYKVSFLTILKYLPFLFLIIFLFVLSSPSTRFRFNQLYQSFNNDTNVEKVQAANGIEQRKYIWNAAIEVISDSPIYGFGDNCDRLALESYYTNSLGYNLNLNAHNQYLQTLLSSGILGLSALFYIFGVYLKQIFKSKQADLVYLIFIFLNLSIFMTESFLHRQKGIIFFTFLSSLLLFTPLKQNNNDG